MARASGTVWYTFHKVAQNGGYWERVAETSDAMQAFKWYQCGNDVDIVRHVETCAYITETERTHGKRLVKLAIANGMERKDAMRKYGMDAAKAAKLADVNQGRDKSIKWARKLADIKSASVHGGVESVERVKRYYAELEGVALGNTRDI